MSIAKNAVNESRAVARLAVDAAKNELIEQLAPQIKSIIDAQMRAGALGEDVDRLRRAADGYGETEFEEGKDMKKDKDKMESVAALFPGVTEMVEADDPGYDDTNEGLEEGDPDGGGEMPMEARDDDSDMDESLELSEAELAAIYREALQLEVDVKKGFSDMAKPHELGAGAKAQYQSDPANLADYGSGEKEWDNVEPPAKKKWTVESLRPLIRQGMQENRKLSVQNAKLREMVKSMHGKLSEMNLLNSKIMHVNKFVTNHRLNVEQKRAVIESIDRAETVTEVKKIFSILESSYKAAGAISESNVRRPRADSQRRRSSGAPDSRVLRESADRSEGNSEYARLKHLAGLVNG